MKHSTSPRIVDMTDDQVAAAIIEHRDAAARWDAMAAIPQRGSARSTIAGGVLGNLRLMDIAIAVKRSRIRRGVWTLPR